MGSHTHHICCFCDLFVFDALTAAVFCNAACSHCCEHNLPCISLSSLSQARISMISACYEHNVALCFTLQMSMAFKLTAGLESSGLSQHSLLTLCQSVSRCQSFHDRCLLYVQVITISGRTIRKQAQASPEYAEAAIECISKLLAACPQEDLDRAQQMRKARMNVKAV